MKRILLEHEEDGETSRHTRLDCQDSSSAAQPEDTKCSRRPTFWSKPHSVRFPTPPLPGKIQQLCRKIVGQRIRTATALRNSVGFPHSKLLRLGCRALRGMGWGPLRFSAPGSRDSFPSPSRGVSVYFLSREQREERASHFVE